MCADVDDGFAVTGLFVEGDVLDASLLKKKRSKNNTKL
jgi:hypothetical protein